MDHESQTNQYIDREREIHLDGLTTKDAQKEKMRASIRDNSSFDAAYILMNALATIVACYGLFADSAAVVIGAMIIAMLLGPIAGVALALVDGDNALLKKALGAEVGGVLVVLFTAFTLGLVHRDIPITREIMARTSPNFLDLMVALAGGAAGAYASISPRLSVAFVGVAIATALVPPLSSCSILLARGETKLAGGAFLLAFTNIVAIQFASSLVMWLNGFHRITRRLSSEHSIFFRNAVSILILLFLSGTLLTNLRDVVSKLLFEANTRRTLQQELKQYPGAHLAEVRFGADGEKTIVRAVVRGPQPFSPEQVGVMEAKLPSPPNETLRELRLRYVHTTVVNRNGQLFSSEEESEHASKLE